MHTVLRFGPELARRTECARALEFFYDASVSLATADKSAEPSKARAGIPCLLLAGGARGPRAATFSSLCVSGGGAATLALVEKGGEGEKLWNVISLAVAPEERNLELISEAGGCLSVLRVCVCEGGWGGGVGGWVILCSTRTNSKLSRIRR